MRILIVEDRPKSAEYLRQGLSESGYTAGVARTGIDGRHLAETGEYDLVLLDLNLPGLDGWGVLQAIRARDHAERAARGRSGA